jgi:hypothetical protein
MLQRRINAPLQFQGLKGRYIFYGGGMLVGTLVLFIILYMAGVNLLIAVPVCLGIGFAGIGGIYRLSDRLGEHGWRKRRIARRIPHSLLVNSQFPFINLKRV